MGVAIAVGLMILTNGVVGGALLRLAARTRKQPELLIGLGLFLLGPVSQVVALLAGSQRKLVEDVSLPLHALAAVASAVGMACIFLFVRAVFRPRDSWAAVLAWGSIALLAGNAVWNVTTVAAGAAGVPAAQVLRGPGGLMLVLFTAAFGWAAIEAGLYARRATKQTRIGLLDPIVANRFALWTIASGSAFLLGAFLLVTHLRGDAITLALVPSVAICVVSVVTGAGMYLAFIPPRSYLAWVQARAATAQ